jgi:hypothetical protein
MMLYLGIHPRHDAPEPAMSLSTQLNRGKFTLPLLALLGLLAFAAGEPVDAHPELSRELPPALGVADKLERKLAIAEGRRLVLEARVAQNACGPQARPPLLLAQAPADLGPIAQRQGTGCRAGA